MYPIELRHRLLIPPGDTGCAAAVLLRGTVGDVVGAGEVVVGKLSEIENIVVRVQCAFSSWSLVEWITDKEVRPGEYPLRSILGEASFASDGVIFLSVRFVPHLRREVLPFQVAKPDRLVGKLPKH